MTNIIPELRWPTFWAYMDMTAIIWTQTHNTWIDLHKSMPTNCDCYNNAIEYINNNPYTNPIEYTLSFHNFVNKKHWKREWSIKEYTDKIKSITTNTPMIKYDIEVDINNNPFISVWHNKFYINIK